MTLQQLPTTMRAVQGKDYGPIDAMLSVEDNVALTTEVVPKDHLLLKTHAVALAPGDCRVLSGKTRPFQGPPSFPYIPGGDVCGTVVKVPEGGSTTLFQVGDRVAARFVSNGPIGGLAEYSVVHQNVCDKVPASVSSHAAAALASATPALCLADRIQTGDRVLIIGAGGGVGSHLCQFIRKKASFVAGVAGTDPQRLLEHPYLCNEVVDYTKEDFLSNDSWRKTPFDVVVDLAGGTWPRLGNKGGSIVKPTSQGGRYLTTTPDEAVFEMHSIWGGMKLFLFLPLARAIKSRTWARRRLPKYTMAMSLPEERAIVTRTLEEAANGTVEAVIDGPYDFTTEGIRQAFRRQESRHAKGKVVITVSKE